MTIPMHWRSVGKAPRRTEGSRKRSDWQTPDDEEFFERHRHFTRDSPDLRKRLEKVVFGKAVECFDFLDGFVTVAQRLVLGAGETKGERFLCVRIRRGRKDWRTNFNHDVGAFFSMMNRGLAESLGERVEWKVDGQGTNPCDPLFDYPNFFANENKNGKLKQNTSGSRVATQLKFEVFLIERVDGAQSLSFGKTQLLWSARPQAIGLALKEDVERLLDKGGVACTDVPRKLVSTKGAAQTVSLLDVGTLEAIFGRDSGTLVPPPGRLASMRKDIKDRIDEEAKKNRYSAEQRNEIRAAWDTFEVDYIQALNDFINVGLHSEAMLTQAQSFGALLRTLLEHARGDVCRSRLLARVLAVGTARLSGEPPALIIPPWHPERLKALSVKTRRSAGLVAHMLVGDNVTFGDWKIFFRDFPLFLSIRSTQKSR